MEHLVSAMNERVVLLLWGWWLFVRTWDDEEEEEEIRWVYPLSQETGMGGKWNEWIVQFVRSLLLGWLAGWLVGWVDVETS